MTLRILIACVLCAALRAGAHPLLEGSLDITAYHDKVTVRARVTVEEVAITNSHAGENPIAGPWAAQGQAAFDRHAAYLARHIHILADNVALTGRVVSAVSPDDSPVQTSNAVYELEYPAPAPPRVVTVSQDVLSDGKFTDGQPWQAKYILKIGQDEQSADEGAILTAGESVNLVCQWPTIAATPGRRANAGGATSPPTGDGSASSSGPSSDVEPRVDRLRNFSGFFREGVHHILTGYDHLLFISALVLAAVSVWDLVKVVTAFTLAHTLTLTLAALHWVHVSERISEPLISLSIVCVALQNVFWPRTSRGWPRMAAAFFFGLFHGLGFSGGLLDVMGAMRGTTVLLAILAFSIGVEAGHQMIVLPLFAALKIARATQPTPVGRARISMTALRVGSAAISIAGLWFLYGAMRLCILGVEN